MLRRRKSKMKRLLLVFCSVALVVVVRGVAVSQPIYQQQYASQSVPTLTYKQQQYKQVYEPKAEGLQYYATQPQPQQQQQQQQKSPQAIQTQGYGPVRQVFIPTNQGPRQIDPALYDQLLKSKPQPVYQQQQQPQQVKYVSQPQTIKFPPPPPQPQYSAKYQQPQPARKGINPEDEDDPEGDYDPNPSYQFGFDVKDDQFTNYQTRKEERDGKKITGSYSVVDSDGYIRTVKYTADPKEGFKAEVSREPTDIKIKIPKPVPQYQTLPRQHQQQQGGGGRQQAQPEYIQVGTHRLAPQRQNENVVYYQ